MKHLFILIVLIGLFSCSSKKTVTQTNFKKKDFTLIFPHQKDSLHSYLSPEKNKHLISRLYQNELFKQLENYPSQDSIELMAKFFLNKNNLPLKDYYRTPTENGPDFYIWNKVIPETLDSIPTLVPNISDYPALP